MMMSTTSSSSRVHAVASTSAPLVSRARPAAARRAAARAFGGGEGSGGLLGGLARAGLIWTGHDVRDSAFYGFTPAAELWVGRWAMLGFASGVAVELFGAGGGIVEQVGLEPSPLLAAVFWGGMGAATVAGAAVTLLQAVTGEMRVSDARRIAAALGVDAASERAVEAAAGEARASPDAAEGVEGGARAAFLASGEATDGAIAAEGPYMRWPRVAEAEGAAAADLDDYARRVERQNGRAAMVGFALAVGVELVNGHSTVEQILDIFQAVGLIGVSS